MYTPIITPTIYVPQSQCPKCGRDEKRITVCAHCDHEYKEEEAKAPSFKIIILLIILVVPISLIIYGIGGWLINEGEYTLVEIYQRLWDEIRRLRIY